jgi:DNA primase small subunit
MNYLEEECSNSMSRLEQTSRFIFLRNIIREYYSKRPLEEPSELHKREIALESLEDGAYIRHLSFPYMHILYDYITKVKTPMHLYYSSALYSTPDASRMEDKGWEGSELMFDIDADKYPGCDNKVWICPVSGDVYASEVEKCPRGEKPVEYSSLSWDCIVRAWQDISTLVDILSTEFGFHGVRVYFSGNRGFHLKVHDSTVFDLSREARRAIADYVSCEGLNKEEIFPVYRGLVIFIPPEYGLRRRVLEIASQMGIVVKKEIRGIRGVEAFSVEHLDEVLAKACIQVDKAVTMDPTRLSRFGNSLNMKAGLRVVEIDLNKGLDGLDYFSFSPFKGSIRVKSLVTGDFEALGARIFLKRGEVYKLDAPIGIYLVLKNVVLPLEYSDLEVGL